MEVEDRPGVLSAVAGVFAEHDTSLRTVRQEDGDETARLIVVTHSAREGVLEEITAELHELDAVRKIYSVIRLA